jgi:hypothetical protein
MHANSIQDEPAQRHLFAPPLEKSQGYVERENQPLCERVCMASCINVRLVEQLIPLLKTKGKWVLYTP